MTKEELRLWDYIVGCVVNGMLSHGYEERSPKEASQWANSYAIALIKARRKLEIDE